MSSIGEVVAQIRVAMQHTASAIGAAQSAREQASIASSLANEVAEGSARPEPGKAVGAWLRADAAVEEAVALLAAGNDTIESYLHAIGPGSGKTAIPAPRSAPPSIPPPSPATTTTKPSRPPGVPPGWERTDAWNGRGDTWQRPGALGNADAFRIMLPTKRYPLGYVRFYNAHAQPVGLDGKPGPHSHTHIPIREDGSYDQPQGWHHGTD